MFFVEYEGWRVGKNPSPLRQFFRAAIRTNFEFGGEIRVNLLAWQPTEYLESQRNRASFGLSRYSWRQARRAA